MSTIKLGNNLFLTNKYGKYQPNLTFVHNSENINSVNAEDKEFLLANMNLEVDGTVSDIIEGKFRINKKGTCIFDTTKKGQLLLQITWGGSFDPSRGVTNIPDNKTVYKRHTSSNGGGLGYDYYIVPANLKIKIKIDDYIVI